MPIKQNKGNSFPNRAYALPRRGHLPRFPVPDMDSVLWTKHCPDFSYCRLWSGISCDHHAPWRSVSDITGSSVYEVCRSLGPQHRTSTPTITLGLPSPKARGLPTMLLPAPTACLPLRLLHSKSYKKRGICHSSLCRTPSVSPFWTQMVMNLE